MKTKILISACLFLSMCAFSQIKQDINGNVIIGSGNPSSSYDLTVAADLKVNDDLVVADDLNAKDITATSSFNTSSISGLQSIYNWGNITFASNTPMEALVKLVSPEVASSGICPGDLALEVWGDIEYNGTLLQNSDKRLKKDIKNVSSEDIFTKFSTFDSKTYQFLNRSEMLEMYQREEIPYQCDTIDLQDENDLKRVQKIEKLSGKSMDKIEGAQYISENVLIIPQIKTNSKQTNYGFLAQEVEKEFPELVKVDAITGLYSVDYVSFIPLLFQATKELKAENDELKAELATIKAYLGLDKINDEVKSKSSTSPLSNPLTEQATISQNKPNPFSEITEIDYFLPEGVSNAKVYIYDMNGKQLKTYPLYGEGQNTLVINGGEFYAGMFTYAFVVDGVLVDSKRMILTE